MTDFHIVQTPHPTVDERIAAGRAARRAVPRSSHADWHPSTDRVAPDATLAEQDGGRLQELVSLRYERMLAGPFPFYRGAAAIMAADLARTPASGLQVQCCGDAHLANFGGFASPERDLLFDINDFDETLTGPWEWDVKRLAASFEIAGRDRGFDDRTRARIVNGSVTAYREAMASFAALSNLDVWYARLDTALILAQGSDVKGRNRRIEALAAKARSKDSLKALTKLTEEVDGRARFRSDPPLVVRAEDHLLPGQADLANHTISTGFASYRASLQPDRRHLLDGYEMVDIAHKVVGVGSVGTRCWIMLLLGRDGADPLMLQMKQANQSVLQRFGGLPAPDHDHGRRVVEGQRLTQAASDIFLGWLEVDGIDGIQRRFYVRQLWDWKLSPNLEAMEPTLMHFFGRMCGWTLARAHARSGDRIAIASYLGKSDTFDRAIGHFAIAYAAQNERDHTLVRDRHASSDSPQPTSPKPTFPTGGR